MNNDWQVPKKFPILKPVEVHVWLASIKDYISQLDKFYQILSDQEKQRAQRFVFNQHRERFIIVHGILRQLLADYLQITPEIVSFIYDTHGKPKLDKICFNISHSNGLALFAFAKNFDIGVDIEFIREDFASEDIARRFFSEREAQELLKVPIAKRTQAFFNCWTRKEAFIKAIGKGLSFPLDKFDVEITAEQDSLLNINSDEYKASDWTLSALYPASNYAAALAVFGDANNKIRLFKF